MRSPAAPRERRGARLAPGRRYDESPVHRLDIAHAGTVWAGHAHTPDRQERPSAQQPRSTLPATRKQLAYLRNLAQRAGQTFTTPRTRSQASVEIRRLQATRNTGFTFAELEAERAARELNDDLTCSIKPFEVSGVGSSATRSQRS
jgi:hypothetical protein